MRENNVGTRLLGYIQLRVGDRLVAVPVESMKLDQDGGKRPGGFYAEGPEGKKLGIYVDEQSKELGVAEQIRRATHDAVRHMSRKFTN